MKTFSRASFWFLGTVALLASVSPLRADDPATFKVADITFTRPAKWESVAPGSTTGMRKAQFKVTDAAGKTNAEVVFFVFPGGAGTVQANIDRWIGLFQEPKEKINSKVETITVGKTKVTYFHGEGTYLSGMPGGPKTPMADFALEGAIIEADAGNIFVRMTGPRDLVKVSVPDFKKMIASGPGKS
jgi:hypothetical protein